MNWLGNLIGGVFGAVGNQRDRVFARRQQKNSIWVRGLVNDAQAAGIHPLAILGANVPSSGYAGSDGTAFAQAGQGIGEAIGHALTSDIRDQQYRLVESQIAQNDAMADAYTAEANRNRLKATTDFVGDTAKNSAIARVSQIANSQQDAAQVPGILDTKNPNIARMEDYLALSGTRRDKYALMETPFGEMFMKRSLGSAQNLEDMRGELADYLYPFAFLQDISTTLKLWEEMEKPNMRRKLDKTRDMRESLERSPNRGVRELYVK